MELLECVPNVSEGRNFSVIQRLAQVISNVQGVRLLNVDTGKAANRTVYTFIGPPQAVLEAAFQLFFYAKQLLSMEHHRGEHPRVGIVDVCPLIPVRGITIEQAKLYAEQLAERVGNELHIPVYLYEKNASFPYRTRLEQIRLGEYEGFANKMSLSEWKPDYGPHIFNKKTGVSIIGARNFLLAFNVNLCTKDVQIAKNIAVRIRESGGYIVDSNGKRHKSLGLLEGVKAIGWYIKDFDIVQVSTNITNFERFSMYRVFSTIQKIAQEYGTDVKGSEVIGLIPLASIQNAGDEILRENPELGDDAIQTAINVLGLRELKEFYLQKQILEYAAEIYED